MFQARANQANYRARQLGYISNLHVGELEFVFNFFKGYCAYCHAVLDDTNLEFDHPIALNGDRSGFDIFPEIVVPCCQTCNRKKSNKNFDEFIDESHKNFYKILQMLTE